MIDLLVFLFCVVVVVVVMVFWIRAEQRHISRKVQVDGTLADLDHRKEKAKVCLLEIEKMKEELAHAANNR
jgi:predicted Holliday junction resolvase-like endonuclease